jgi:alpha-1,3-rhamnosyltransferase
MTANAFSSLRISNHDDVPLVSVLVPAYNHERYVVECLESIKRSGYKRLELLFSDDFSRDRTYELTQAWVQENAARFERVVAIKQPSNLGVVKNIQFLFDNSLGEYLTILASDDLLVESGIAERVQALETDKSIDAVFGNAQLISESGAILRDPHISEHVVRQLSSRTLLLFSTLINWCAPGPGLMLRREAVAERGSLGRLPADLEAEDRYIYIRLASQGKIRFLDSVVAQWRAVRNSSSRSPSRQQYVLNYIVESDKKNRSIMTGFNRMVLELVIAKHKTMLRSPNRAIANLVICLWRIMAFQLRVASRIRLLLLKLTGSLAQRLDNECREPYDPLRRFY